ncbi:MAG: tRNA pseudouridine(55) synthase TruB [Eubacteriales bacterium]|jgi:tRNA pseudouridine55 synthase
MKLKTAKATLLPAAKFKECKMKEPTVSVSEPCGIVVVDKPAGVTSHDVVNIMRRTYGTRRVGHAGTLDPMATGVLIVLVGRAVKVSEHIMSGKKRYSATLRLGVETDTEDITGTVVAEYKEKLPSFDEVQDACRAFLGEYMQTPPMYSALKRGGQKLVDLARRGVEVERTPRPVYIYSISAECTERPDEYKIDVFCSSGTYVRTLCADIGRRLGCGGCMSSLRRTGVGSFDVSDAKTLDEIASDPAAALLPTEAAFTSLPRVSVSPDAERKIRNGVAVWVESSEVSIDRSNTTLSNNDNNGGSGELVCLYNEAGAFFALGEIKRDKIKLKKLIIL